jgi:hypothetical protein
VPGFGDVGFTVANTYGCMLGAVSEVAYAGATDVAHTGVAMTIGTVLGALFAERRWAWLAQPSGAVTAVLVVAAFAATRGSLDGKVPIDAAQAMLSLLVVSGSVRAVRNRAVRAIGEARTSAMTDSLTGLANRRGLEVIGAGLLAPWARCRPDGGHDGSGRGPFQERERRTGARGRG